MHCSLSLPCVWKKEEITNPSTQVDLIDDDYKIVFELSLFAINIKREFYGIIKSFLYLMKKENVTTYYVWCLILDLKTFI
jgi:hypothetical protein